MNKKISIIKKESSSETFNQDDPFGEIEISLIELLQGILKRKKLVFISLISVMILTAGMVLFTPNTYRSTATILPSGNQDKMAELKSIAGLGSMIPSDENSSVLYPVILSSRLIMDAILNKTYTFKSSEGEKNIALADYFNLDEPDRLYPLLTEMVSIDVNKKNGVIDLGVETKYPGLSQAILNAYLAELENYNLHKRRSQAKENVAYLSRQLEEKKSDLAKAQDKLEEFQQQNQNWSGSTNPEIIKALSQLQMDIEVKAQSYIFISQEYEMARRDVQNDIPIVQILDMPSLPTKKTGPHRILTVLIAGILAFSGTLFYILAAELIRKRSQGPDKELYRALRNDMVKAVPLVNRFIDKVKEPVADKKTTESFYI